MNDRPQVWTVQHCSTRHIFMHFQLRATKEPPRNRLVPDLPSNYFKLPASRVLARMPACSHAWSWRLTKGSLLFYAQAEGYRLPTSLLVSAMSTFDYTALALEASLLAAAAAVAGGSGGAAAPSVAAPSTASTSRCCCSQGCCTSHCCCPLFCSTFGCIYSLCCRISC